MKEVSDYRHMLLVHQDFDFGILPGQSDGTHDIEASKMRTEQKTSSATSHAIREQVESDGQAVVFLKGPEESTLIYSMKEWEKVLERTKATLDEDQSRLFMHFVVSEAGTSELDKAGRILIPSRLRKIIPLDEDQEIVLVGLYHRMEIWNPSTWRRYIGRSEERYDQNMSKILNLL